MKKIIIIVVGLIILAIVGIRVGSFLLGYAYYEIPSNHMMPTLNVGDRIVVDEDAYDNEEPNLSDLVTYVRPDDGTMNIGRVVALPETTFEIKDGQRYISGNIVNETYIDPAMRNMDISVNFGPYKLPKDAFFILGDNRDGSFDSRYFGHIQLENIVGKVIEIKN